MAPQESSISSIIAHLRSDPLLLGDYGAYRAMCSRKVVKLRKRLGRASSKSKQYTPKPALTAEEIGQNFENAHLFIYSAERAWAHAMLMKSSIADSGKPIPTGTRRKHIISRFEKAHRHADQLVKLLLESSSNSSESTTLEAKAYSASLAGSLYMEKRQWEKALQEYSTARLVYSSLLFSTKNDIYKDLLSTNIDPSVRYGAYQMQISRSLDTTSIVQRYFPKDNEKLVAELLKLNPNVLQEEQDTDADMGAALVTSVTWRGRTAPVQDGEISSALTNVQSAEKNLQEYLKSHTGATGRDQAGEFDDILGAWQESVDITKKAIDDAVSGGVSSGDEKLQALQLTYTYVNYNLITWRIRRNQVMVKGLVTNKMQRRRKLGGLKEELALWDAILQSLGQVTELPGVAADEEFGEEIEGQRLYFLALKLVTIAQSHLLLDNRVNALALYNRALEHVNSSLSLHSKPLQTSSSSKSTIITLDNVKSLQQTLQANVTRTHALVEMDRIVASQAALHKSSTAGKPLIETLNQYPIDKVDFSNLVTFPPKFEPVPVKPVFLDVAWNFVEYPGKESVASGPAVQAVGGMAHAQADQPGPQAQQSKGWFGSWRR